jgi:hypothetical protein
MRWPVFSRSTALFRPSAGSVNKTLSLATLFSEVFFVAKHRRNRDRFRAFLVMVGREDIQEGPGEKSLIFILLSNMSDDNVVFRERQT